MAKKKRYEENPMKHVRKPIPRPGNDHKSKRDYNRKVKHKGEINNA